MSLVHVELGRLISRRLVRVVALVALVGLLAVLVVTAVQSHAPGQVEVDRATAIMAEQQRSMPDLATQRQDCLAAQEQERATNPSADFDCEQIRAPQLSDFMQDPRFRFAQATQGIVLGGAMALALLGFLVGASFIGAEWQSGTLSNLLLFEPRRARVFTAKAAALAVGVAAIGVVFMAVNLTGHYLISATRGDLTGTTAGLLRSVALGGVRAVLLAVVAALAGYALAGTLRHTAAALGMAFGYVLAGEVAIRAVWAHSEPWLLSNHVVAWIQNGFDVHFMQCQPEPGGGISCGPGPAIHLSLERSALYLGVALILTLAVFLVTFRRRDIA